MVQKSPVCGRSWAKLRLKGMLETFPMTLPWCLGCKHSHLCPCGLLLQSWWTPSGPPTQVLTLFHPFGLSFPFSCPGPLLPFPTVTTEQEMIAFSWAFFDMHFLSPWQNHLLPFTSSLLYPPPSYLQDHKPTGNQFKGPTSWKIPS